MRQYRLDLTTKGQHSPLELNEPVCRVIDKLPLPANANLVDIGCGLGEHARLIKERFPDLRMVGIDFSPATINYLRGQSIFDEVHLCSSSMLPLEAGSMTVSLSMENLEHLYYDDVLIALREQQRVSDYMVITTPLPSQVMNIPWLMRELPEALRDDVPLSPHDYTCLESAVHKSVVYPHSMAQSGFNIAWTGLSMVYFGKSSEVDLQPLEVIGIQKDFIDHCGTSLKDRYTALLKECLRINGDILVRFAEHCTDFHVIDV